MSKELHHNINLRVPLDTFRRIRGNAGLLGKSITSYLLPWLDKAAVPVAALAIRHAEKGLAKKLNSLKK